MTVAAAAVLGFVGLTVSRAATPAAAAFPGIERKDRLS